MKKITKNSGILITVAALLFISTMLVTRCGGAAEEVYTPPPGMGAVRLVFNNTIARTTLPDNITNINQFTDFSLQFIPTTPGVAKLIEHIAVANLYDPIDLVPGVYKLTVIAYLNSGPAATGEDTGITITDGGNANTNAITLKPFEPVSPSSETGLFAWSITTSGTTPSAATLTLTAIGTGASQPETSILSTLVNTTGIAVAPGYYYADFKITVNTVTITFRHIAHIYQNMKSTFTYALTDDYFFKLLSGEVTPGTIDYENPTDNPPELLDSSDNPVGDTVTLSITANSYPSSIIIKISNIYTSYAWYCRSTTSLNSTNTYIVDATTGLFAYEGDYYLTAVGITSGKPYATSIVITVVP